MTLNEDYLKKGQHHSDQNAILSKMIQEYPYRLVSVINRADGLEVI